MAQGAISGSLLPRLWRFWPKRLHGPSQSTFNLDSHNVGEQYGESPVDVSGGSVLCTHSARSKARHAVANAKAEVPCELQACRDCPHARAARISGPRQGWAEAKLHISSSSVGSAAQQLGHTSTGTRKHESCLVCPLSRHHALCCCERCI